MGKIVLLDELTINQIAAGEVIERPASVIKEMIENSIDAGATNIIVEIKNGGISYIRITDNGKGIARDDVELAFERHATSKIRSAVDLQEVKSMGFRGEALASVAAIANVELVSKTIDETVGTKIVIEGGKILDIGEAGCQTGTTITVRNLFFNTPVRYKFLKRDFTESGYIEDVITRIALVHPEIAIKLVNSGKTVIQTSGSGDLRTVVYSIYGKDIATEILPVSYEYEYIKISGVIGKPVVARSNRANQLFFVNKRYIKDKTLTSGAEQAFRGLLPIGKFGFLILNLEMPSNKVDVNVHPAKLEVRFEEESVAFKAIYHSIKNTLLGADLISDREKNKNVKEVSKDAFKIKENIEEKNEGGLFGKINLEPKSVSAELPKSAILSNLTENMLDNSEKEKIEETILKESEVTAPKEESQNTAFDASTMDGMNVFDKMRFLQNQLKEQVRLNPKLQLTEEYKRMQEKYEEIAIVSNNISKDLESKLESKKEENQENVVSENQFDENLNIESNNNEIQEIDVSQVELPKVNIDEQEIIKEDVEPQGEAEIKIQQQEETEVNIAEQEEIKNGEIQSEIEQTQKVEDNQISENEQKEEQIVEIEQKNEQEQMNVENEFTQEESNQVNQLEQTNETEQISETQEMDNSEEKTHQENLEDVNEKILSFETMYKQLFGKKPYYGLEIKNKANKEEQYKITSDDLDDNISVFEDMEEYNAPTYKFIGIAFKTYIILEMNNELYIMDQHAAHERILYEKVKKNFYSEVEKDCQMLLLPDIITLTNKEMGVAKDNFKLFEKAGFMLEEFGENTIKLSGVPEICVDLQTKELFLETLDEINTVARTAKQEKEEKFIETVACKAAVKANMALTEEEVNALMKELLKLQNPFSCPHGRPTVIKMSKYEIEKKFARK